MRMSNVTLGMALIVLAFLAGCVGEVPEEVALEGINAMQSQPPNYIYALVQFDKFLEKYPEHEYVPKIWLRKAHCHMALGELEEALEACDNAISAAPGTDVEIEAALTKSSILTRQGQWEKAAEICQQIIDRPGLVPNVYPTAWKALSDVYLSAEQWDKALETYDAMIESASIPQQAKPILYRYKISTLGQMGEFGKANQVLIELNKEYPEHMEFGISQIELAMLMKDSKPEIAEKYMQKGVERIRELSEAPAAATAALTSGTAVPPLGPGGLTREEAQEFNSEFMIAQAYAAYGDMDKSLKTLEDLREEFKDNQAVFQRISQFIGMLQQRRLEAEKEDVGSATQQAVSAATATLRSVSP